jgi:hypothetical protein
VNSIISDKDFFKIDETDRLILGGHWESMYLIDKKENNEVHLGDFEGVVDIGVVSKDNSWAITGREVIFLWRNGQIFTIDQKELGCVEGIKLIGENLVLLEVDSLNLNGNKSEWTLHTVTHELVKIK